MYVGALTLDVLLGDVRSLKQKRSVVRPLVAEVRRHFPGAAVAETGHLDLHRRAEIGVAVVSSTAAHAGRGPGASASDSSPGARRSSCCRPGGSCFTTKGSERDEPGQGTQAR